MKYVDLDATVNGISVISPAAYLAKLPDLAPKLPEGACVFATDPSHYDFYGERCVKDLKLETIRFGDDAVHLRFRHNCWKHEEDLEIAYQGIMTLHLDGDPEAEWLGQIIVLDEILPHEHGCSHEIGFHSATLTIVCRDLRATWMAANCPDQPPRKSSST